jgi:type VI secretion system protein ImpA
VEPTPEEPLDDFHQAIQTVKSGNTSEGLAVISKMLATERSNRLRFKRRTQLAHLLMAGGKEKVAQPLLDQLAAEIEERRLEDWEETEAIAYPLSLLLRCLAVDGGDTERRTQLYARICKLDPIRALDCSP